MTVHSCISPVSVHELMDPEKFSKLCFQLDVTDPIVFRHRTVKCWTKHIKYLVLVF